MKKTAFALDLDGTVVFLGTDWGRVRERLRELYSRYKLDVGNKGIFKSIFEARDLAGSDVKLADDVIKKAFAILDEEEMKGAPHSKLREDSGKLLDHLRPYDVAIVSSNCRRAALKAFDTLGISAASFKVMVMRDDVVELKPNPEPILKALKSLKEENPGIERLVCIGDQKNDMLAAKGASELADKQGVKIITVALSGGASFEEKLKATSPDFFTKNLAEVLEVVRRLEVGS